MRSLQEQGNSFAKNHEIETQNLNLNSTQAATVTSIKGLKIPNANQDLSRNPKGLKGQFYNTGSGGTS